MSLSGAAHSSEQLTLEATGTEGAAALRNLASERLAAHRRRRAAEHARELEIEAEAAALAARKRSGTSRVREAVAARYQNSVSYREFLAKEAERALQQAQAEAEVAARKAEAMAEAQMELLAELEQWTEPRSGQAEVAPFALQPVEESPAATAHRITAAPETPRHRHETARSQAAETVPGGLTVKLLDDIAAKRHAAEAARPRIALADTDTSEASALDEEIAFRLAPEFEPPPPEPIGLAGNVIEFPRQLIAARKARPRLAEGPLREEDLPLPQLRIFEVEPDQISFAPAAAEPAAAPEWQSLLLSAAAVREAAPAQGMQQQISIEIQTARTSLRVMAGVVDACCVAAAFIGFITVVGLIAGPALRALPLPLVGASAGLSLGVFYLLYQLLFFTLQDATPGMRYARIALCTFSDENPSRKAMRRRVLAKLLAACPLGLGIAWTLMDTESLGWHDRMSRVYPRGY